MGEYDHRDVIALARAFVEEGWTQEDYAKTAKGNPGGVLSPRAISWCLWGALDAADTLINRPHVFDEALAAVKEEVRGFYTLEAWNDAPRRTQTDVFDLLDRVWERA